MHGFIVSHSIERKQLFNSLLSHGAAARISFISSLRMAARSTAAQKRKGRGGPSAHGVCTRRSVIIVKPGSFSAVSKPTFARKYALESSRRDLHNALLCTALQSQIFFKNSAEFCKILQQILQILTKKMRLQSCAKECIV